MDAMHANGLPFASPRSSAFRTPSSSTRVAPATSSGMPSARAKSLPRPAGHDPERGGVAQRAGELADEPVAAQRHDHLAAPGCLARGVRGVGHVARLDDAVLGARRVELPLQAGQHAQRLAPGGRGVHQDRETAVGAHGRRAR